MIDLQAANFLLRLHKRIHLPPCESNYIAFHFTFVSAHYSTDYWVLTCTITTHGHVFTNHRLRVCNNKLVDSWHIVNIQAIQVTLLGDVFTIHRHIVTGIYLTSCRLKYNCNTINYKPLLCGAVLTAKPILWLNLVDTCKKCAYVQFNLDCHVSTKADFLICIYVQYNHPITHHTQTLNSGDCVSLWIAVTSNVM